MQQPYVEERQNGYWVSGTRVSLDSVVHEFLKGYLPESIAKSFPALSLEPVLSGESCANGR